MREVFFILFISSFLAPVSFGYNFPSTGDGSNGACNFSVATPNIVSNEWNCTVLTVSSIISKNYSTPFTTLTFRVKGDVHITGSGAIDLNGKGHTPNAGPSPDTYAVTPPSLAGLPNPGHGGGGGGGSHHNSNFPPTSGSDPTAVGTGVAGAAATKAYGGEDFFDIAIYGGAGGATGQSGQLDGAGEPGSLGGAGGGIIKIISGGDIIIDGSIIANGENGADSTNLGGAGGGGAGGSIYLQAAGDIRINGIVTTIGGTGGSASAGGGNGGNGAHGRIRLDDYDGIIENNGIVTPTPYTKSISRDNVYNGTMTCGTTQDKNSKISILSFLLGLILIVLATRVHANRKAR